MLPHDVDVVTLHEFQLDVWPFFVMDDVPRIFHRVGLEGRHSVGSFMVPGSGAMVLQGRLTDCPPWLPMTETNGRQGQTIQIIGKTIYLPSQGKCIGETIYRPTK